MISNVNMSVAGKLGQQFCLGYNDSYEYNENTDGYIAGIQGTAATGQVLTRTLYLSAPLPCLLSNAEKLIPLNGTNIRLQLTTDALANFCPLIATLDVTTAQNFTTTGGTTGLAGLPNTVVTANAASQFTGMTISNFEVVYNQVQFPPHIDQEIRMQSPKIRIKTTSYATGTQTIASGSLGTSNLIYNLRYASIKGLFLMNGGSSAYSKNKLLESFDMTRGGVTLGTGGSYQFGVNGINYPMNPISTSYNKGFALQELRRAMNNIWQNNVDMSVNANEFNAVDSSSNYTSVYIPAKFYVAVNTQRLSVPYKALFTGISSQNSPITAIINLGSVATSQNFTCILALYYDAIIEIDLATKQVNYVY